MGILKSIGDVIFNKKEKNMDKKLSNDVSSKLLEKISEKFYPNEENTNNGIIRSKNYTPDSIKENMKNALENYIEDSGWFLNIFWGAFFNH